MKITPHMKHKQLYANSTSFPLDFHKIDHRLWNPSLLQRIFHCQYFNLRTQRHYILRVIMVLGFYENLHYPMVPWFWWKDIMFVLRMLVWVHLHNLPLHFWNECVLEGIGTIIGRYTKTYMQCLEERIYTFSRICVQVDLNKGLPESIQLKNK